MPDACSASQPSGHDHRYLQSHCVESLGVSAAQRFSCRFLVRFAVLVLSRLSRNASAGVEVTGSRTCRSCGAAGGSTTGSAPRENRGQPICAPGSGPGECNRFWSVASFIKDRAEHRTLILRQGSTGACPTPRPTGENAKSNGGRAASACTTTSIDVVIGAVTRISPNGAQPGATPPLRFWSIDLPQCDFDQPRRRSQRTD